MEKEVKNSTKKMLMYFIVFSITMLFGGFISAYIVSSMGQYWVHITPPTMFVISNALIVAASVALYLANKTIKSGSVAKSKMLLVLTLAMGLGFAYTQYSGWKVLESWGGGWNNRPTEFGVATSWNSIETMLEGSAVYGEDYEIKIDDEALIFDLETRELYAPNDPLKVKPITHKVKKLTNTSGGYLWVLIVVHMFHLAIGLVYLMVNLWRVQKGVIDEENNVQIGTLGTYWHFLGGLWLVLFFILFSV
jgi:heme/copper-type cytochrome/quinol oxidase subunit 3